MSAARVVVCALLGVLVSPSNADQAPRSLATTTNSLEKTAAAVLYEVARRPENGIPDGVLNSTRCVVIVPLSTIRSRKREASGVMACRDETDQRHNARRVAFTARPPRTLPTAGDLLILLTADHAAAAVTSGGLPLNQASSKSGPLVRKSAP